MPSHIAAGRTDHISTEPGGLFEVQMDSRRDGSKEYCTMEYAVERLIGWYAFLSRNEIEATLRRGTPLETIGFFYHIAPADDGE